jgi:ABC-type branched-subunit amino acid transport system substrate-binding protein
MTQKNKIVICIVIVIAIFAAITTVNKNKNPENITLGVISGLSGDYAAVGEAFMKGVDLAQEEWNTAHPDKKFSTIKEDDAFDSKKGLSAYRKLTSIDRVDGLINMTTITIDATYADVVKLGIPFALGFEQGIDAKNDNVVQLWPGTSPAQIKLGAEVREKGFKNLVVFVDNTSDAFRRFADAFEKGYGLPVQEVKISADGNDLRSAALKATTYNPDAIVFIVKPTSGAQLVKELKNLNKGPYQFVFDANIQTGFTDYVKILGDTNILNGSILYTVPNVYRSAFNDSFKKKFGSEPSIGSETGYNAFMLLALNYDSNKTKWVNNMQKSSFEGADGKVSFDEYGVRIPELKIGTIENGKLPN